MRPPGTRPWGGSFSSSSSVSRLVCCYLAIAFSCLLGLAAADSRARNPLRTIARLHSPVVHTPDHRVHAHSVFQLSFTLEQQQQPQQQQQEQKPTSRSLDVRLRLRPNHDILADDAVIHHIRDDGTVVHEPIARSDHRVYMGDAFVRGGSIDGDSDSNSNAGNTWVNAGWASVYVHHDGLHPVFEGAFHLGGDHHHIQTSRHFLDTRVAGDPIAGMDASDDTAMVVWRDSDIVSDDALQQGELRRSLGAVSSLCSADGLVFNRNDMHPVYSGMSVDVDDDEEEIDSAAWLFARQIDGSAGSGGNSAGVNLANTIGNTAGCPSTRKVALLGVAADCTYAASFSSRSNVSSNIIQQINSASRVYESSFNISLGIQNLVIQDSSCPSDATVASTATPWNAACSSGLDITERLNRFSKWRGESTNDTNAFWMLLTTCATDSAVGLAWLGQLCVAGSQSEGGGSSSGSDTTTSGSSSSSSNETTAATNVIVRTSTEWQVMAHETGHTFGAVHDCTSETCSDGTVTKQQCCPLSASTCNAGGQFIMNPSTGTGITQFSACTIGNVCSALGRNSVKSTCLSNNKNVVTITGSECGNGIVEEGEECDCGGTAGCRAANNTCCDPATCKFAAHALCDPSNDECCTSACQLASANTVCRASTGSCDPPETCSGTAAACPVDVTSPDGTSCTLDGEENNDDDANLACASGQCTSRNLQCKTLMGSLTTSNDTYACSSQGCRLSCASPEFGFNQCLVMDQNFLDGTPCQGGGHCDNGNCADVDTGKEIASVFRRNLEIVVPVCVVVGILILAALGGCIRSCLQRSRQRRHMQAMMAARRAGGPNMPPPQPPQPQRSSWFGFNGNMLTRNSKYYGPPPPPQQQQQQQQQDVFMTALPPHARGPPPDGYNGNYYYNGGPQPNRSAASSDSGLPSTPPPPYVRPPPSQEPWRPTTRFA